MGCDNLITSCSWSDILCAGMFQFPELVPTRKKYYLMLWRRRKFSWTQSGRLLCLVKLKVKGAFQSCWGSLEWLGLTKCFCGQLSWPFCRHATVDTSCSEHVVISHDVMLFALETYFTVFQKSDMLLDSLFKLFVTSRNGEFICERKGCKRRLRLTCNLQGCIASVKLDEGPATTMEHFREDNSTLQAV